MVISYTINQEYFYFERYACFDDLELRSVIVAKSFIRPPAGPSRRNATVDLTIHDCQSLLFRRNYSNNPFD
jgi:hypothetical protein